MLEFLSLTETTFQKMKSRKLYLMTSSCHQEEILKKRTLIYLLTCNSSQRLKNKRMMVMTVERKPMRRTLSLSSFTKRLFPIFTSSG